VNRKVCAGTLAAQLTQSSGKTFSLKTLYRTLHSLGFKSCVATRKPYLKPSHLANRLHYAKAHKDWVEEWDRVVFSDESFFTISSEGRFVRVWRRPSERYRMECCHPTFQKGGGGIMVWGAMTAAGLGPLVRVQDKINSAKYCQILEDHLLPYMDELGGRQALIFQQDNAPSHKARSTMDWFASRSVNLLDHPACSPDLNPIERIWDILDRMLRSFARIPSNNDDLFDILQSCWNTLRSSDCANNLVSSMPQRLCAVVEAKGGHTAY